MPEQASWFFFFFSSPPTPHPQKSTLSIYKEPHNHILTVISFSSKHINVTVVVQKLNGSCGQYFAFIGYSFFQCGACNHT